MFRDELIFRVMALCMFSSIWLLFICAIMSNYSVYNTDTIIVGAVGGSLFIFCILLYCYCDPIKQICIHGTSHPPTTNVANNQTRLSRPIIDPHFDNIELATEEVQPAVGSDSVLVAFAYLRSGSASGSASASGDNIKIPTAVLIH